jgi:hypothetical protein
MIRIAITVIVYDAIVATLPIGTAALEPQIATKGVAVKESAKRRRGCGCSDY